jgi:hypothetical protein
VGDDLVALLAGDVEIGAQLGELIVQLLEPLGLGQRLLAVLEEPDGGVLFLQVEETR